MIVVDNVARGILPRIFWHVPDDKLIFAANQDYLLNHQDLWLSYLNNSESIYISELSYGNTAKQQQKMLDLISQEYEIVPIEGGIWGVGDVFKMQR